MPLAGGGYQNTAGKGKVVRQGSEITIGATEAEGGTRTKAITIGGETAMPFMQFEGRSRPNGPWWPLRSRTNKPADWSDFLRTPGARPWRSRAWAKAAEEAGADLLQLTLGLDNTPETAVAAVRSVLQATGLPLIVFGPGQAEKDNELLVSDRRSLQR